MLFNPTEINRIVQNIYLTKAIQKRRTSQGALVVKNSLANAGDMRCEFNLWVGKIPWRRAWQPTLVFLPEESHGQKGLAVYSP